MTAFHAVMGHARHQGPGDLSSAAVDFLLPNLLQPIDFVDFLSVELTRVQQNRSDVHRSADFSPRTARTNASRRPVGDRRRFVSRRLMISGSCGAKGAAVGVKCRSNKPAYSCSGRQSSSLVMAVCASRRLRGR